MTGRVQLAYLHGGTVSHSFHASLVGTLASRSTALSNGGGAITMSSGSGDLAWHRNRVVQVFLERGDAEWLWFVDTDMGWAPDAVDRLLAAADPEQRPVVGALCFSSRAVASDGLGGERRRPVPTIFAICENRAGTKGFVAVDQYPRDSVIQVGATGTGFLLIHRSVLEKVEAEHGPEWFTHARFPGGQWLGEDLAFMAKLGILGVPVHVHTGVKTSHHKSTWISEEDFAPVNEPGQ